MAKQEVVLEVEGIVKRFPGVLANDNVSLTLHRGEILALLGENGAGKSTLMNIVYGLYHQDSGAIRVKGREVQFASPRDAIQSGIGMVHQHFQLIPVMTVAENVVLGEEEGVAFTGGSNPLLQRLIERLPSVLVFILSVILGFSLGEWRYVFGGAVIGAAAGVLVAFPPLARWLWGAAWRVGVAFLAIWIAARMELITQVALTDIALRQKVETFDEERPQEMDGYTVKGGTVERARISFDWRREARDADGIAGLMASAKTRLEEYRDQGVPGWLIDAIDDVPPVAHAVSVALLLALFGWHSLRSWRGMRTSPGRLENLDLGVLGALAVAYTVLAWLNLDTVETAARAGLTLATAALLAFVLWRTIQQRAQSHDDTVRGSSPFDGVMDAVLSALFNVGQIRNERKAAQRVQELSKQYGLEVDPDAVIEKLAVGTQQRVEIVKALYRHADILILDEPTAVLTPQESRELFKIMRELAAQGVSIIFITHKLKEVFEVATHIVVMRDGHVVGTTTPREATEASLAEMMVGREVILEVEKEPAQPAASVLKVTNLNAYNDRGAKALNDVSFEVCAGEVLGIAGVQGNGQTELVEVLSGLRDATGGSVRMLDIELQPDVQPEGKPGARLAAFVVDMLIVAALAYLLGAFVAYFGERTFANASLTTKAIGAALIVIVVDFLYFFGSWKATSTTIGMSWFSLQIATRQDRKPGLVPLFSRYLIFLVLRALVVPGVISFVLASRDPQQRNWFDRQLGLRIIHREHITPRRIKDVGTSHVPEDRQRHGLVKDYSVADNLVLNDYYLRPYAQSPNGAELPVTVLSYVLVFGLIMLALNTLMLWAWDEWLWTALLDLYDVPEAFRTYDMTTGMSGDQTAALQWPFIISMLALIAAELVFGLVAHLITIAVLGLGPIRRLIDGINHGLRRAVWQVLGREGEPPPPEGGLMRDQDVIRAHGWQLIEEYDIRTPSTETSGGALSGGNQQKMIVAREFSRKPRLLIAAQPTRGIDVGSIEFIHRRIIDQRDEGAAVLLVSAELDEIMALSDRIAVLYKGEVIDTLLAGEATREQLGLLMAGIRTGDGSQPERLTTAPADA